MKKLLLSALLFSSSLAFANEQANWAKLPNLQFDDGTAAITLYSDCDEQGQYTRPIPKVNAIGVVLTANKKGDILNAQLVGIPNARLGYELRNRLRRGKLIANPNAPKRYEAYVTLGFDNLVKIDLYPTEQCQAILQKLATETAQTPQNEPVSPTPPAP